MHETVKTSLSKSRGELEEIKFVTVFARWLV